MKRFFYLILLIPVLANAQNVGVRVGDGQPTELLKAVPGVGSSFVVAVPNSSISFCQAPANGVPCTNKVTTYTDSSLNTACKTSTQLVLSGTTNCVGTTDAAGKWGVWVLPGEYAYTVTANGASSGPFFVTAGGSSGGTTAGVTGIVVATPLFGGTDICQQITNAMAALPADGGIVQVPAGDYQPCAGVAGIGIVISKPSVTLRGVGRGSPGVRTAATMLHFAPGVTGIDITGGQDNVEDIGLYSRDTSTGTADGIRVRGGAVTLHRVGVSHFGGNGVVTDGGISGGSADLWHYEDVTASYNYGDGFRWAAPCVDNHLGTGIQLNGFVNGGWGFNIQCGLDNDFITSHAAQNAAGGFNVAGTGNYFHDTYIEGGIGSSFVVSNGAVGIRVWFTPFGQPDTIVKGAGNEFYYWVGELAQQFIHFAPQPGTPNAITYRVGSGVYADPDFGALDLTNNASIFHYDPTTKWHFDQPAAFTATATRAGVNIGSLSGDPSIPANGDIWYNVVTGKFRCYESGAVKNCIGSTAAGGQLIDARSGSSPQLIGYPTNATGAYMNIFTGSSAAAAITANGTKLYSFVAPVSMVSSSKMSYSVSTADNTGTNRYNFAIFDTAGNIICQTGSLAGNALAPSTGVKTHAWATPCGPFIEGQRYYFAQTGTATTVILGGQGTLASPVCNVVPTSNGTTATAVWTTPIGIPVDNINTACVQPQLGIFP